MAALDSFPPKKVIQIVGGYDKGLPFTAMCKALIERAKAVLCIGDDRGRRSRTSWSSRLSSSGGVYRCGDLATAMKEAKADRGDRGIVLLSTGTSSYDQFANFEERGDAFAKLGTGMKSRRHFANAEVCISQLSSNCGNHRYTVGALWVHPDTPPATAPAATTTAWRGNTIRSTTIPTGNSTMS